MPLRLTQLSPELVMPSTHQVKQVFLGHGGWKFKQLHDIRSGDLGELDCIKAEFAEFESENGGKFLLAENCLMGKGEVYPGQYRASVFAC